MFESLGFLSDQQVRDGGRAAVSNEREATLVVLNFLIEIEKRKLYLEDGYSSMFDYCTSAWGYSSSAAWRRIQTSRCIVRFPRTLEMLERDELNLSTIALASRVLNEQNCDELLPRLCGTSRREAETIASEYREEPAPRERAKTVMVRLPAPGRVSQSPTIIPPALPGESQPPALIPPALPSESQPPALILSSPDPTDLSACENSDYCRGGSKSASRTGGRDDDGAARTIPAENDTCTDNAPDKSLLTHTEVVLQKRVALSLSVPVEFMTKMERLRAVTWHRLPAGASFSHVLNLALDIAIAQKDPAARRRGRESGKQKAGDKTSTSERYIPQAIRDEVYRRDENRCTYVSKNGRRCTATAGLQVDHIKPIARGGKTTIDNLRLLCAQHNRYAAKRLMGP
jgi:hypothetical protein